jgi:ADP-ribose pyrophosphatase
MPAVPKKDGPEEIVFQGKIVEVVKQPMKIGDKSVQFEFARRSPGTRLLIVDKKAQKILLTKEYRHELDDYDYRLPGGKVFDSLDEYNAFLASGQDILEPATKRAKIEAKEETGIIAESPKHFYTSVNGATVVWDLLYFIVDDWEQAEQELEAGEDIVVTWLSYEEVKKSALKHMSEDRSAAVLLRWLSEQQ